MLNHEQTVKELLKLKRRNVLGYKYYCKIDEILRKSKVDVVYLIQRLLEEKCERNG